jgi:hypothetical protein
MFARNALLASVASSARTFATSSSLTSGLIFELALAHLQIAGVAGERLVGSLAIGDVARAAEYELLFGKRRRCPHQPAQRAVFVEIPVLEADDLPALLDLLLPLGDRRVTIVRMHEVHERPRHQFGLGIAKGPLPGGIHALEVAVEPRDAEHVVREHEEPIELLLRPPPIHEQPDLVANAREHRQQVAVRRPNFPAEELHYAENFASKQDGESERAVQAFPCGNSSAREVRVVNDVGNPDRLAGRPDAAGQTDAPGEGGRHAGGVEFRDVDVRGRPNLRAAENVGLTVDRPERPVLPVERVADRLKDFRHGLDERRGVDQRAGNHMLGREPPFGQPVAAHRARVWCHGREEWRL